MIGLGSAGGRRGATTAFLGARLRSQGAAGRFTWRIAVESAVRGLLLLMRLLLQVDPLACTFPSIHLQCIDEFVDRIPSGSLRGARLPPGELRVVAPGCERAFSLASLADPVGGPWGEHRLSDNGCRFCQRLSFINPAQVI